MGLQIIDYGKIEPSEVVPFRVSFTRYSSFKGTSPESITAIAVKVYLASDTVQTNIPAMIQATAFGTNYVVVWCGDPNGATAGTYHFRVLVSCQSGSKYEEQGEFIVEEVQ